MRNVASLRGLSVEEINKRVSPLVAGGWLTPETVGPFNRAWAVSEKVFEQFEQRARLEAERKAKLAALMKSPRKPKAA